MPYGSERFSWKRYALSCVLGALFVPAIVFCFERNPSIKLLLLNYLYGVVFSACVGGCLYLFMPLCWVWSSNRPKWMKFAGIGWGMLAAAVIGTLIGCAIFAATGFYPWSAYWASFSQSVRFSIVIT